MMRATTARVPDLVLYPESDGKPMGETDLHVRATIDAFQILDDWFEGRERIYVASDNFIYYEQGNPKRRVSPDCYVVKGVSKGLRRVFKVWEEGAAPCFVLEITSKGTRLNDLGGKMAKYRDDLGVREYFLFDPEGEWIEERLRGFQLNGSVYLPIAPDSTGRLPSRELGLELAVDEGGHLRFWEPGAEEPLIGRKERVERERAETERERAEKERERAEKERERAEKKRAQAEVERLKTELEKMQRKRRRR